MGFNSFSSKPQPSLDEHENTSQTPKQPKSIFTERFWKSNTKHDFTPLRKSYESTLEELLQDNLIVFPKATLAGVFFMNNYCAYHRHNLHKTSH